MAGTDDFELVQSTHIAELAGTVSLYRHLATGAEVLSLENEDENKVFGVGFRTAPTDSTGAAHIIEHTVLAGSKKYPVKEPFIELVKGSLATYVNASTFEDKTVYPVASQNRQDFYNLIDVYLDAVFNPLLDRHTFEREGWHLSLDQSTGMLTYKGVVFNEMKGQVANPDYVLIKEIIASLFPDTPYANQSGGHPTSIPELSYDAFLRFYREHYHPGNARFFFYGDDPPELRLQMVLPYLESSTTQHASPEVDLQQNFKEPHRVEKQYPGTDNGGSPKHALAVSWVFGENIDPTIALQNRVLNHILMGTPASPLRKALTESGLGEDVFGSGVDEDFGLWTMLRQLYFSAGMKGVPHDSIDRVEAIILDTLEELASTDVDQATILAAINTIEFSLRENNFGAMPRGIILMLRALSVWNYGHNPIPAIAFDQPLNTIKRLTDEDPHFFQDMIREQFLENQHRVTLHLSPDPNYLVQLEELERTRLDTLAAELTDVQKAEVIENAQIIQSIQETPDRPEDLAKLPLLALDDLEPKVSSLPLEIIDPGPGPIWIHPLPTYGITYLDLGFDLHSLSTGLLGYLSVFGRALLEMGTRQHDYVTLSKRIGRQTGGIDSTVYTSPMVNTSDSQTWLFVRGKSMFTQSSDLFEILGDLLTEPNFDQPERFKQIVLEEKARLESGLLPAGHAVINRRIRSAFNEAGWVDETVNGVEALLFVRDLISRIEHDWNSVLGDLERIHASLITRGNALFNLTLPEVEWSSIKPGLIELRARLDERGSNRQTWDREKAHTNEGLIIPAQVSFVGKGAVLDGYGELSGALIVANLLLRTTWLWERVRLQGGAYGAFCLFNPIDGGFTFFSYRDPQVLETLQAFDDASQFLSNLELAARELQKTIIGSIGRLDAYQLPDAKGFTSMIRRLTGMNDTLRQSIRDQVLSCSVDRLQECGQALRQVAAQGRVVVMGSKQAIETTNKIRTPSWLEIVPLL